MRASAILLCAGLQLAGQAIESEESRVTRLATSLFQIQRDARGVEVLQRFLQAQPDSYRASLLLAFGLVREGKYAQARQRLSGLIRRDPRDAYAHHVMGLALLGLHRNEEAIASLRRAIAIRPDGADTHFQLGLVLSKVDGRIEPAYAALQRAAELGHDAAAVQRELGSAAIKLGRLDDAIRHLQESARIDPDVPDTHFLLADAFRKSGRGPDANAALQRFTDLNSDLQARKNKEVAAQALYQEGMKLLANDDLTGAFVRFQRAVAEAPAMDPAHYRIAQIDYLAGRLTAALGSIRQAIDLNPSEAEYYFVLARCVEDSDGVRATAAIREAIKLNDTVADFHNLLGNLLARQGDDSGALQSYQTAVRLEPANEAYRTNLAIVQGRLRKR